MKTRFKLQTMRLLFVVWSAFAVLHAGRAGTLTGSLTMLASNSVADLTAEGAVDWVHWGTHTEFGWNRKVALTPQIGPLVAMTAPGNGPYQFSDNVTGYSWSDGTPDVLVTNTTTGIWAPGKNNGFQLTVPADTTLRRLRVYVGAFEAQAQFEASLSDGSALPYSDSSIDINTNAPGGVYTLVFAANTNAQTLTVTYVVKREHDNKVGNVTWQAATLANVDSNNPPSATLIEPSNNAVFSAGTNLAVTAIASDFDGTVSNVEFFQGLTKLGEATNPPYAMIWSNAPAGDAVLRAVVTDNGGLSFTSSPVEVFIHTNGGGMISGSVAAVPGLVDLSAAGSTDWSHWGLGSSTGFDHKAGVTEGISNAAVLGGSPLVQVIDYPAMFSWTNGTPTGSAFTSTAAAVAGSASGFELNVPAMTSTQTLTLYLGLYASGGTVQAFLSDFSAPAFTDSSLKSFYNNSSGVYSLSYFSASSNQTLTVRYISNAQYDMTYGGSLWLAAATLSGSISSTGPRPPLISCGIQQGIFTLSFSTEASRTYTVEWADSMAGPFWQTLTNFTGDGNTAIINDPDSSGDARFFRVKAE
jgi:hypothetical protein